jgi:hypothetical protein
MRLEQMAEPAHRRLVRHRLTAKVDANKMPHRLRIVERLLDCRVGQIEPVLQEIKAQHPLDPDRRAAIAWLRIKRLDQLAQRRPRHYPLHLGKKDRAPCRLGVAIKYRGRQRQLLHPPAQLHQSTPPTLYTDHCSWLLQRFLRLGSFP